MNTVEVLLSGFSVVSSFMGSFAGGGSTTLPLGLKSSHRHAFCAGGVHAFLSKSLGEIIPPRIWCLHAIFHHECRR